MNKFPLSKLSDLVRWKWQKANQEWAEEQKRKNQEVIKQTERMIKAEFQEPIKDILARDVHFDNAIKVNITHCRLDNMMQSCCLIVKAPASPTFDMTRHTIIIGLNDTADTYWGELKLKAMEELEQLRMEQYYWDINPDRIQLAEQQITKRYRLLNFSILFESIEYESGSKKNFVNIRLCIRAKSNR